MLSRGQAAVEQLEGTREELSELYLEACNLDASDSTEAAVEIGKALDAISDACVRLKRAERFINERLPKNQQRKMA